jgi:dihydrofolate reductase
MNFSLFVAFENNNGIAYENKTPWNLPSEFKYYIDTVQLTKDKNKKNA